MRVNDRVERSREGGRSASVLHFSATSLWASCPRVCRKRSKVLKNSAHGLK